MVMKLVKRAGLFVIEIIVLTAWAYALANCAVDYVMDVNPRSGAMFFIVFVLPILAAFIFGDEGEWEEEDEIIEDMIQ